MKIVFAVIFKPQTSTTSTMLSVHHTITSAYEAIEKYLELGSAQHKNITAQDFDVQRAPLQDPQ